MLRVRLALTLHIIQTLPGASSLQRKFFQNPSVYLVRVGLFRKYGLYRIYRRFRGGVREIVWRDLEPPMYCNLYTMCVARRINGRNNRNVALRITAPLSLLERSRVDDSFFFFFAFSTLYGAVAKKALFFKRDNDGEFQRPTHQLLTHFL